jgi:hypothetical protein
MQQKRMAAMSQGVQQLLVAAGELVAEQVNCLHMVERCSRQRISAMSDGVPTPTACC